MKKTIYEHLDLSPGAGKTEMFVLDSIQVLKQKNKIIVYAAPNVKLLAATYARFHSKLVAEGLPNNSYVVISKDVRSTFLRELGSRPAKVTRSSPINILNLLLGMVSYNHYKKSGGVFDFLDQPVVAEPGMVIFTTHSALSGVRDIPSPKTFKSCNRKVLDAGGTLDIVAKTHIYFDEARDCVIYNKVLSKLKRWQLQAFLDECEFKIVKENEKWKLRKITDIPNTHVLKQALGIGVGAKLPSEITQTVSWFRKNVGNAGRNDLLICDNLGVKADADKSVCAFGVLWPGRVFRNYGKVTFLSAFFKTSEMFHMLKEEGIKSLDLVEARKVSKQLLLRDQKIRKNLFRRSKVAVLCDNYAGMKGGLSSNQLKTGLLIPIDKAEDINNAEYGKSRSDIIADLVETSATTDIATYLGAPLIFLALSAIQAHRRWGGGGRMLTVLNSFRYNTDTAWAPSGLKYRKFFQAATHRDLLAALKQEDDEAELDEELMSMVVGLKDKHIKILTQALNKKSKSRVMEIPDANQLHGLNRWDGLNAFCYLAAIVPPPHIEQMYSLLIPGYDAVDDSSIENLVQTMMRINLRRPDDDGEILLVLPFQETADRLANKIVKDTNLGLKTFKSLENWKPRFAVFNPTQKDLRTKAGKSGGEAKRGYSKYGSPILSKLIAQTQRKRTDDSNFYSKRLALLLKVSDYVLKHKIKINSKDDLKSLCPEIFIRKARTRKRICKNSLRL